MLFVIFFKKTLCLFWQIDQLPSAQRFHDYYRDTFGVGILLAGASGLGMFIVIVVLYLAEVPVISVQELAEFI